MYYGYQTPWRGMDRMLRDLNSLFGGTSAGRSRAYPKVNAWSNDDGVVLSAELPGVDPESLEISVQENVVTISGENPQRCQSGDSCPSYHRSERPQGRFKREFRLPYRIDGEKVQAESRDGILTLTLKRLEADKPRKISVHAA